MEINVVIIGSLSQEDEIKKVVKEIYDYHVQNINFMVFDPISVNYSIRTKADLKGSDKNSCFNPLGNRLYDVCYEYVSLLRGADYVVVIPKEDGSIGESATYELAIASFFKAHIVIVDRDEEGNLILDSLDQIPGIWHPLSRRRGNRFYHEASYRRYPAVDECFVSHAVLSAMSPAL